MPAIWLRGAVLVLAALTAACGGTSRVADQLNAASLSQSRKAVALIKLGAADPLCTVLSAGIGVREGGDYRLVQTARIERNDGVAVAELELGTGEYHVVSYHCVRRGGSVLLAEPAGSAGLYKKSYATFALAPGEVVNIGYLHLVPIGSRPINASYQVLHVHLAVTDWPVAELDRFKQQRPNLYSQMHTRLMTVHKIKPPTVEQVQAQIQTKCAEMRRLQAEGKLQNLPELCTPGGGGVARGGPQQRPPASGKRQIGI
jgi:hypothetical protein